MYTKNSTFIATTPLANLENLAEYCSKLRQVQYTYAEWVSILKYYDNFCRTVQLDAYLVTAQMLHETAYGRSWWSARPRCNPAGLRVTGEKKQYLSPTDINKEWQYNPEDRLYHRGLSLGTWRIGVVTHIGHLLCYVYKDNEMNAAQERFAKYSPNVHTLNRAGYRGTAKKVDGLSRRWAVGEYYGEAIARVANTIKEI